jgi:TonB family protein
LLIAVFIFTCKVLVPAQGFEVRSNKPITPTATDSFTSLEGRFSIALPSRVSGFRTEVAVTNAGRAEGSTFDWKTVYGAFTITVIDRPGDLEGASQQILDHFRDKISEGRDGLKPKLLNETIISSNGHPGRDWKFEIRDALALTRMYLVRNRIYTLQAYLSASQKSQEAEAVKILDTFKLLTQEEAAAQTAKKVADAAPALLPQEPVADRPSSDAKDAELKGKVKTVFTETADLSGTWTVSGRKPLSMEYFNEQGNLTKSEQYDYRGNLGSITVYGYLDGERVSSYKSIERPYNPPPMLIASPPGTVRPKSDPRYSIRHSFKYDDKGRLTETALYQNTGELFYRSVYNYSGNQIENLIYGQDGTLNQKYMNTLDENGNRIENSDYDIKDGSVRHKYSHKDEFDSTGNWIKRITSEWKTKDGKSELVPSSVSYRTITYYDSLVKPGTPVIISSVGAQDGPPAPGAPEGEVDKMLREERGPFIGGSDDAQTSSDSGKPPDTVSGGVLNAKTTSKPVPVYPAIAKQARATGAVTVKVIVGLAGKVIAAQAVSGHPLLRAAAVKAAREARFEPTYLDKEPVKVVGVITYNFVLQ